MRTVPELVDWIDDLPYNHHVAIAEGGLTLMSIDETGKRMRFFEIGGVEPEMPWCKWCKSYHVIPRDRDHHRALKCFAPWKPPAKRQRADPIIGICEDAKALGVTREHLLRVLKGIRKSKSLTARYNALKKGQSHGR